MIKIAIKIMPKQDILDTAGRTLCSLLKNKKFDISNCSYGKCIELSFDLSDKKQALAQANQMAEEILHNHLVEQFELEVIE